MKKSSIIILIVIICFTLLAFVSGGATTNRPLSGYRKSASLTKEIKTIRQGGSQNYTGTGYSSGRSYSGGGSSFGK